MKFVAVGDDLRVRCVDESGDESVDVLRRRPLGRRRCVLYEVLAQNTCLDTVRGAPEASWTTRVRGEV